MNENIMQEIVHELFSSLEALETQSAAVLQFLKDKGLAGEQELAPYLEGAGNASSVRWRAARVRIDYLISSAVKAEEREEEKQSSKAKEDGPESSANTGAQVSGSSEGEKNVQDTPQGASGSKPESDDGTSAQKSPDQSGKKNQNEGKGENVKEKAA